MASIVIAGDTSGAITLSAPAVAGTNTITLPAQTATIATLTTPSFATTIGVGGATPAASGAGITFPATKSPSSDANTLDDYEEGTWTPVLTGSGGSAGSYAAVQQEGFYTKIGNTVFATVGISMSNLGSWSGAVRCSLPFTVGVAGNLAKGTTTRVQQHSFTGAVVPDADGSGVSHFRFNLTSSASGQSTWQWSSLSSAGGNYINTTFIYQV
jgi:hypothetical protein